MKTYKVQRMTEDNYHKFMSGSWYYDVETLYIDVHNAKEAALKAQRPGYRVNENYICEVTD